MTTSSALLCQIAPLYLLKNLIRSRLGYEPEPKQIIAEGWHVGFRLVVRRAWRGIEIFKGFSSIISWREIAKCFEEYLKEKANKVEIEIIKKDAFRVSSSQNPRQKYFVYAHPTSLSCSCMKYHCLRNRHGEAPKFFDNLNNFSLEVFDMHSMQLEKRQQIVCHHIYAVMSKVFGVSSLQNYADMYKSVSSSIEAMQLAREFQENNPWNNPPPPPMKNPWR